ncbi:MAG: phage major tail tube protein, partial [Sutterella sp.]
MATGSNRIPERLINYRVYGEGNDLLGVANVELPSLEAMSDTVSGAGIAGEVESPILGHYGSMTVKFTWRTITAEMTQLAVQKAHALDLRGSQQIYDASLGEYSTVPVHIALRATPKTVSLGSFEVGSTTDSETEFEVLYLKITVDGKEVAESDKYNFVSRFNGEDKLASIRKD